MGYLSKHSSPKNPTPNSNAHLFHFIFLGEEFYRGMAGHGKIFPDKS